MVDDQDDTPQGEWPSDAAIAALAVAPELVAGAILAGPYRDAWSGNADTDKAWRGR